MNISKYVVTQQIADDTDNKTIQRNIILLHRNLTWDYPSFRTVQNALVPGSGIQQHWKMKPECVECIWPNLMRLKTATNK